MVVQQDFEKGRSHATLKVQEIRSLQKLAIFFMVSRWGRRGGGLYAVLYGNTLFVYLLFCKNVPPSISKQGFVLLHTFNGWHTFDHFFPFLFYRVDDLLKIIKWILKPKLFAYLYVQITYLYLMCTSISRFKYVNSSSPFKP